MIKEDRATFKCPFCETVINGWASEIAVKAYEHYRKDHT